MRFDSVGEAMSAWAVDRPRLEEYGISFEAGAEPVSYLPEPFRRNYAMAQDAQPAMFTQTSGGIPAMLTTYIDPNVIEVIFAPVTGAEILGEVRRGTWIDKTAMFPVVEHVGEVSSYGDYSPNGRTEVNANWPARQSYLFQTFIEVGDLEIETFGAARIDLVAQKNRAAADIMNRALNLIYHFGVVGIQNYGILNEPSLSAALTPATKANGGVTWFTALGAPNATSNEVFNDVVQVWQQLVSQTFGMVTMTDRLVLVMPPGVQAALSFTNSFGLTARKMVNDNFPNLRIVIDPLYGLRTTANPMGVAGGNIIQMIAETIQGQETGYAAYNEKMRAHRVVPSDSSFRQKKTSGSWGFVIRMPLAISQMLGV